ncbi:NigD-like protein [uncultured Bacteroides sp.]|uniref:NigD-like protein n=1 Tax=uncultured Bacteroides sp. TaxID=162156 RepID=UPI002AA63BE7|nr:NigD-like protein [uncultured Bacteroides sp.]
MKRLRFAILAISLLVVISSLQSCLDDDDNDRYSLAIATVKVIDGQSYYFALDDNTKMLPGDTTQIYNYPLKDGQRAFVYFNLLDEGVQGYDYNAKIRYIENILTKGIIPLTEATADSIGDDHISPTNMWIGGGYLNIEFRLRGTDNPTRPHMLNLVQNATTDPANEEEGYINLEFRHNAYDDSTTAGLKSGIVSFNLSQIANLMTSEKGLKIRVNTLYDGIKYYKIDFKAISAAMKFQQEKPKTTILIN